VRSVATTFSASKAGSPVSTLDQPPRSRFQICTVLLAGSKEILAKRDRGRARASAISRLSWALIFFGIGYPDFFANPSA
jgi:hypothetical protein